MTGEGYIDFVHSSHIKEKNAATCTICNFPAHIHSSGMYLCQNNVNHVADMNTGIFSDLADPVLKHTGSKKKMSKIDNFLLMTGLKVFAPVLQNPRSVWGKKMKEKLLQKKS
jgi:hypothetical protein